MRILVLGLAASLVMAPALALAGAHSGTCRRLTRQITQYEGVAEMADQRGNGLWEAETRRHIERLELKREGLCPEYKKANPAVELAKSTRRMIKKAAITAFDYFTTGGL